MSLAQRSGIARYGNGPSAPRQDIPRSAASLFGIYFYSVCTYLHRANLLPVITDTAKAAGPPGTPHSTVSSRVTATFRGGHSVVSSHATASPQSGHLVVSSFIRHDGTCIFSEPELGSHLGVLSARQSHHHFCQAHQSQPINSRREPISAGSQKTPRVGLRSSFEAARADSIRHRYLGA